MNPSARITEIVKRAALLSGAERQAFLAEHLAMLPLLRSTVLDLLAADNDSFLPTGGALDSQALHLLDEQQLGPEGSVLAGETAAGGMRIAHLRIERPLGQGGMGTVYLGFDEKLQRAVAIKTLHRKLRLRPEARERFEREARILSRLNHPGICQIYDVLEEGGSLYLVLEYVAGRTLREMREELSLDDKLRIVEEAAEALAVAHGEGIVHRDVKPDNFMITSGGKLKILDFGIARLDGPYLAREPLPDSPGSCHSGERELPLTHWGTVLGTVTYMSPEQARGEETGPAGDIFSLGLVLHELVSATPPHPPELSPVEILARLFEGRIDPPTAVGAELGDTLRRATSQLPEYRPDAEQLRQELSTLRAAPARLRRRRFQQVLASAVALLLLLAALFALDTRWRAQKDAVTIEKFAREAAEILWQERALELAPRHDIRAGTAELRQRLHTLEKQLGGLSGPAATAGHRSLGRAFFVLNELEPARRHLEEAAYPSPSTPATPALADAETWWWLGRTYGELYRLALERTASIRDSDLRATAVQDAQAHWRDPALEALRRAESFRGADRALLEALLARFEGRFGDAQRALEAIEPSPWSYERDLLLGDILREEAWHNEWQKNGQKEGQSRTYEKALGEVLQHYLQARDIARSSPLAHARLCRVSQERIYLVTSQRSRSLGDDELHAMWEYCDAATTVDGEDPEILLARGLAHYAEASFLYRSGRDPSAAYRSALEVLSVVPDREQDPGDRWLQRGTAGVAFGWYLQESGQDPAGVLEEAIGDLRKVWRLRFADPKVAGPIATAQTVLAFRQLARSENPVPGIEAVMPLLEESSRRHPNYLPLSIFRGNLLLVAGRYQASTGGPAIATFEAAVQSFREGVASGDLNAAANVLLTLTDLGHTQFLQGLDPRPRLSEALELADALIAEHPQFAALWGYRGLAHLYLGEYQARVGEDPTGSFDRALADHRNEVALGSTSAHSELLVAVIPLSMTAWQLKQGKDPTRQLSEIAEQLAAVRQKYGDLPDLDHYLAELHLQESQAAQIAGREP